ncbi:RING finger and CHY zinc finger domain-containing protein 1-like isoform X2 [Liolophura sinensis]|uniref:RING finger and CHY zinc finger domain-containing protein 1-like isoform X2 n=1 Tax=Liolophura sinensis TaxID=3198878 RepID=UPI003158A8BF
MSSSESSTDKDECETDVTAEKKLGCSHYQRKCSLIANCCKKVYICRVCHDEAENHQMNRHEVQEIKCLLCEKQQQVSGTCIECGTQFARYFCRICNLFDDIDKAQFHCDDCGICRVGGRQNYFHCSKCDVCLHNELRNAHKCIEKVSHNNCPVCLEDLHTSRIAAHIPPCGHLLHRHCFREMLKTGNYACPLCAESMVDMKGAWDGLDEEIKNTPMPEEYRNYYVIALCRDCHQESRVVFHVLGLKCQHCGSYNTCRTGEFVDHSGDTKPMPSTPTGSASGQD